jgi:antirestriction protein ArdC
MTNNSSSASGNAVFKRADLYQQVTDTIIQQLEMGVVPWQRGWEGEEYQLPGLPLNYASQKQYKGINIVLLWCASMKQSYRSAEWATFRQWQEKKELIRKGEKGSMIVYYDTLKKEVDGEEIKIPFLKSSIVFNRCQLQSYEAPAEPTDQIRPLLVETIDPVESFIENTHATVAHIGSRACYHRKDDIIYMPDADKFIATAQCSATENYYATLLHELIHWSGAEKRLNRTKGKTFGDKDYAQEELTAEMGAAFLSAGFGLPTADKGNHAAYIDNWLQVLRNDKHCILKAASAASKAADYLHGIQPNYAPL